VSANYALDNAAPKMQTGHGRISGRAVVALRQTEGRRLMLKAPKGLDYKAYNETGVRRAGFAPARGLSFARGHHPIPIRARLLISPPPPILMIPQLIIVFLRYHRQVPAGYCIIVFL
jgi:hypothetical protein